MENASFSIGCGGGFCGMLTVLFIALKLLGVIDWAWIWVLAPLWINGAVLLVFIIVMLILAKMASR